MEVGLVLLLLTAGLTLVAPGAQKLFGWFGGPGLDATGQFFETISGRRHALMAGLAETGGGLLLALGLFHADCGRAHLQRDARGGDGAH
jgi:putative oxidoreductase